MPKKPPSVAYPWQVQARKDRKHQARRPRQQASAAARGYDADWKRLRERVLLEEPVCRFCERRGLAVAATVVDHIEPLSIAPDRRLDRSNLQALCAPCHDGEKARADRALRRRNGRGRGGRKVQDPS